MSIPVEIVGRSLDLTDWLLVAAAIVQAVGSVAAIVAVIWLTNHDRAATARAAATSRETAVMTLLSRACFVLQAPSSRMPGKLTPVSAQDFMACGGHLFQSRIRHLLRALEAVPLYALTDYQMVDAVLEMASLAHDADHALSEIGAGSVEPGEVDICALSAQAFKLVDDLVAFRNQ